MSSVKHKDICLCFEGWRPDKTEDKMMALLKVVEIVREQKYNKFVRNCQNRQTLSKLYKKIVNSFPNYNDCQIRQQNSKL